MHAGEGGGHNLRLAHGRWEIIGRTRPIFGTAPEWQEAVQRALYNLKKLRTAFIIAHRLATVANADRIVVLKDGQIHESVTHGSLLCLAGQAAKPTD